MDSVHTVRDVEYPTEGMRFVRFLEQTRRVATPGDRSRRSSSSSPVLTPSRTPASTSNWRTQLRTADSVKPRSRATSPIERGPSLTSLTVSSLNSFENYRLLRVMVVTSEAIIASYQVSTKSGQDHIVELYASGEDRLRKQAGMSERVRSGADAGVVSTSQRDPIGR